MNTNNLKDRIVDYLVRQSEQSGDKIIIDAVEMSKAVNCNTQEVRRILNYLSENGFVVSEELMHDTFKVIIKQELFEIKENGGFTRQYELLKMQYEQLQLEIEKLKNDFPEKFAEGTSTINNIIDIGKSMLSAVSFFVNINK